MSLRDLRAYAVALIVTLGALFALSLAAPDAAAQSTGGSFGGGDWSSGGGGGGGGSDWGSGGGSDWGSSGGSDWGSSGGGYTPVYTGGGGGGGMGCSGCCCILLVFGLIVVAIVIGARGKSGSGPNGPGLGGPGLGGPGLGGPGFGAGPGSSMGSYHGPNAMYVTSLSLGIDWRARAQLQAHLKRLAETGDTRSPGGLAQLLSETVLALRRNELSWLYAAYKDEGGQAPQNAQPAFTRLAQDLRSRFQSEVVRGASGQLQQQDGPAVTAKANEGEGTVAVSIVLATRRPMQGFQVQDATQIRAALADRGALQGAQLVALEVIWSPAAESDRMSTAELETVYPEMKLIDPNSIAGRIFCAYCSGPFPAELLNCPHCGAPAEASKGRRSPRG